MSYGVKAARDVVINHGQQKLGGVSPFNLSLYRETWQIEVVKVGLTLKLLRRLKGSMTHNEYLCQSSESGNLGD